jgi:RNA-directed DNA polymerase
LQKLSLETAFEAYFHKKISFNDFLTLDIDSNYTEVFHSKKTYSPSKKLKMIQQFLNHFIISFMAINENVAFAYRPNISVYDAVYPHRTNKYFYTTDIKSFFTSINQHKIRKVFEENILNYKIEKSDILKYENRILDIITYRDILPIGSPCSPKLSNAVLLEVDNEIKNYCDNNKIIFTRYSDDFIFSSNEKELLVNMKENIKLLLEKNDFTLNEKKDKIQRLGSSSRVKILGLIIAPKGLITLDKSLKSNLEIALYFYLNDKDRFHDFLNDRFDNKIERLYGIVSYINEIDKNYLLKFQ